MKLINPIFQTIEIGKDFYRALRNNDFRLGKWANIILTKCNLRVASNVEKVDLVIVTVEELGFESGATREDIFNRAKDLGLELCPHEVGPQLRLQYESQPIDEWLVVATEPMFIFEGGAFVFVVGRDSDGKYLEVIYGYPDNFWNADFRLVFIEPRNRF